MLDKLRKQVTVEFEQLDRLIAVHRPLLEKCQNASPTEIELSALAAMLHSFYSGIENIFKRVAVEIDGTLPTGAAWHRDLLDSMSESNDRRTAVLSTGRRYRLEEYLKFRHFFRQHIRFNLNGKNYLPWCSSVKTASRAGNGNEHFLREDRLIHR